MRIQYRAKLGHIAGPGPQCCTGRPKLKARFVNKKCLQVPTLLIEANAVRSRVFIERNSNDCKSSKGAVCKPLSTDAKYQEGKEGGIGGFNLLAPLRNLTTRLCFPTDFPSTGVMVSRNSSNINLKGGGGQPTPKPLLQKGKHGSDRTYPGQWWSVTKYNYFVTVLKYIFQVSVLYWSSFILSNFYFYFTTFQSIRSYFLLHYIS